jgi:hypothetical protein
MTIVQAERPSYRPLQALAMLFSAAAISVKMPYQKYALSCPGASMQLK